jgi:hypothetical protein
MIKNRSILKLLLLVKRSLLKGHLPPPCHFESVEIPPFKYNCKAAVSISADFELSWAFRGRSEEKRTLYGIRTRQNHPFLLNLFEKYSIPITWATVGHLFLESCSRGSDGRAHSDMPRPVNNTRFQGDWYRHDPCTDYKKDPLWYCPDLIQDILNSKIMHEIGSHSFSHIDFEAESANNDLVDKEMKSCIETMKSFNLVPKSLVFPHNQMGYSHLETLYNNGIIAVRHRDNKVALSYPQRTSEGVYKLYESMNTRSSGIYDYVEKAKIFISEAKKSNSAFHLWFHPSDSPELFKNEFSRIVEYISSEQNNGSIWVTTMSELAAYCEARQKTVIKVNRSENTIVLKLLCTLDQIIYPCSEITLLIHENLVNYSAVYILQGISFNCPIEHIVVDNKKTVKITIPLNSQEVIFRKNG